MLSVVTQYTALKAFSYFGNCSQKVSFNLSHPLIPPQAKRRFWILQLWRLLPLCHFSKADLRQPPKSSPCSASGFSFMVLSVAGMEYIHTNWNKSNAMIHTEAKSLVRRDTQYEEPRGSHFTFQVEQAPTECWMFSTQRDILFSSSNWTLPIPPSQHIPPVTAISLIHYLCWKKKTL